MKLSSKLIGELTSIFIKLVKDKGASISLGKIPFDNLGFALAPKSGLLS